MSYIQLDGTKFASIPKFDSLSPRHFKPTCTQKILTQTKTGNIVLLGSPSMVFAAGQVDWFRGGVRTAQFDFANTAYAL